MAYPDGTTVIRYYPVERFTEDWYLNSSLPAGLSVWVKRVNTGTPVGDLVTTLYPEDEYPKIARYRRGPYGSTPFGFGVLWTEYITTAAVPLPSPGEFAERPFVPITPEGSLAPILPSDLPVDVHIGFSDGDYAGGVVQVGIYLDGSYVEMASFQHTGTYFESGYVAPDGWDGLPNTTPGSFFRVDMGDGGEDAAFVRLELNIPYIGFWTKLKQAKEV